MKCSLEETETTRTGGGGTEEPAGAAAAFRQRVGTSLSGQQLFVALKDAWKGFVQCCRGLQFRYPVEQTVSSSVPTNVVAEHRQTQLARGRASLDFVFAHLINLFDGLALLWHIRKSCAFQSSCKLSRERGMHEEL